MLLCYSEATTLSSKGFHVPSLKPSVETGLRDASVQLTASSRVPPTKYPISLFDLYTALKVIDCVFWNIRDQKDVTGVCRAFIFWCLIEPFYILDTFVEGGGGIIVMDLNSMVIIWDISVSFLVEEMYFQWVFYVFLTKTQLVDATFTCTLQDTCIQVLSSELWCYTEVSLLSINGWLYIAMLPLHSLMII